MRGEQVLEFFERGGVWKTADEKFVPGVLSVSVAVLCGNSRQLLS